MIRRVKVENGWVCGLPAADPRITSYKGIPFAAPPVGENRWRAPQPCADWQGDYLAYDFAPIPLQVRQELDDNNIYTREWAVDPDIAMSEDCLYLNIWAPARNAKNLPVFVWYFGGGLQVGHTAEMEFDGERIARRGIVVVTVSYRLNAFGFLCHPEITAEAPEAPANFGFLDQQFATRWVKRNIAAFGGDPDNITIGGQSAGGMSVCAQMTCPANEGLFQKAIIQSGCFAPPYPFEFGLSGTLADAEKQGEAFFEFLGVKTLAEARKIDAMTLRDKAVEWNGRWGEAVDGVFSTRNSQEWFLQEDRVRCPVLAGYTDSEFLAAPPAKNAEELRAFAKMHFGARAEGLLACFGEGLNEDGIRAAGSVSSIDFSIQLAARTNPDNPLYAYVFAADIPGWDNPGTFHSVDLWFFFETLAKCWRPFKGRHYDLARKMCDSWVNFIRSGDPNGADSHGEPLPEWPPLKAGAPVRMRFDMAPAAESCRASELVNLLMDAYLERKQEG